MQYYGDLLRKLTKSNTTEVCEFFVKKCLMYNGPLVKTTF